MPTLLEKGKILKQKWMPTTMKRAIDTTAGIDFLVEYIGDRMWLERDVPPKAKLKGPGDKVVILRSGTGSGKSTLLPPFLHKAYFEKLRKGLIITQPTKATTTDIPHQILQYNDFLKLGDNIGYQTGSTSYKPVKGILFSTVGILLQYLKILEDEEFMRKFAFIIIDEVHTRSTDIDTALYYLKELLKRNWEDPDCPLIILTSATFDEKIFMEYFRVPKENFMDVVGATFPREVHFSPLDLSDYVAYAVDQTEAIHVENTVDITENSEFRDILIFVQGGAQMKLIGAALHKLNAEVFSQGLEHSKAHSKAQMAQYTGGEEKEALPGYLSVIPVMSAVIQKGGQEYRDLFSDIANVSTPIYTFDEDGQPDKVLRTVPASRRVIIGTNAIETGMTIDTLRYCIDTGFVNESSFNPSLGCSMLVSKNVTQANSEQRKGRIGRKAPGVFYASYTKKVHDSMPILPFPEIVKEDISAFLLGAIINETVAEIVPTDAGDRAPDSFQMNQFDQGWFTLETKERFRASRLDFIQYPSSDSMGYALECLHGLGFIDHEYRPTIFGVYANKFRKVTLQSVRMILASYHHGANTLDLITISCFLSAGHTLGINKPMYKARDVLQVGPEEAQYYYRLVFRDEFVEFLFIWDDFMDVLEKVGLAMEKTSRKTGKTTVSRGYIEKWCEENFLNLEALLNIMEARDEVIQDMLSMGLNPYYNGLDLARGTYRLGKILRRNRDEGIGEIRKLKQCIYEGFRFNTCTWNSKAKAYVSDHYHYNVTIESAVLRPLFIEAKNSEAIEQLSPKRIVVASVMLRPGFATPGMFEFTGDFVSVLDGYVDPDDTFLLS